jgi:cytoskeletal protein CcmA (bactofilin family)
MLNADQLDPSAPTTGPQLAHFSSPAVAVDPNHGVQHGSGEPATIGKGLIIKGEITGVDSLMIEGRVEGSIHLGDNRVTVGRNGHAAANITAREIVVMGKVRGNITATDRVDIRAEGAVIGDLSAPRISIEDGAFFKGGIDIRKDESKQAATWARPAPKLVNS